MMKSKITINSVITTIFEFLCFSLITIALYFLYDSAMVTKQANSNVYADVKPVEEENFSLAELQAINPDVVGWITIDGTNIDYPIMQGTPDYTYLNRDMYGNRSLTGSLYIGYNASWSDDYVIVYGHHMSGGMMFGNLDNFEDADYLSSHQTGTLITSDKVYRIIPIRTEELDAYDTIYSYGNIDVLLEKYSDLPRDKYLILSTCKGEGTDRLILITRLEEL